MFKDKCATERAAREAAEKERDSSRTFADSLLHNLNLIREATEYLDEGTGPNTATALAIKAAGLVKESKHRAETAEAQLQIAREALKEFAVRAADNMEGTNLDEFKHFESDMVWACETLKKTGLHFNPLTGEEAALAQITEKK